MIGHRRLHSLRQMCEEFIQRDVRGDFIETDVWRGGACIMMRAVLVVYGDRSRQAFVCDSFEGLPPPDAAAYPVDAGDIHSTMDLLGVSSEAVEENVARHGLLEGHVSMVKGWFKDTLHTLPTKPFALVGLDGDMYASTIQAFEALDDQLSPGGYPIVDDDGALPNCKTAVHDFRAARCITEEIHTIDWTGFSWRKGG